MPGGERYRLTERFVENAEQPPKDAKSATWEYWDATDVGLLLVASRSGRRFFEFRYRFRSRKRCVRLGEWPSLSLAEARQLAREMRAAIGRDEDPAGQKEERRRVPTLEEFVEGPFAKHAKANTRSSRDTLQRLRTHVLPKLGAFRLNEVTRGDVRKHYNDLLGRMAPATANRIHSSLGAVYTLAVEYDLVEFHPCRGIRMARENNARDRYLSAEELPRYLEALDQEPHRIGASLLKFLLFTGLRRGEALGAQWSDYDPQTRTLKLRQTKAGAGRHVLLNEAAVRVLEEAPRVEGNDYLFPGRKAGSPLAEPKFIHERVCQRAGIQDFRIHDLRHSFASLAASGGASIYSIAKLLGHSQVSTSQRYAHFADDALRAISEQVAETVEATREGA